MQNYSDMFPFLLQSLPLFYDTRCMHTLHTSNTRSLPRACALLTDIMHNSAPRSCIKAQKRPELLRNMNIQTLKQVARMLPTDVLLSQTSSVTTTK